MNQDHYRWYDYIHLYTAFFTLSLEVSLYSIHSKYIHIFVKYTFIYDLSTVILHIYLYAWPVFALLLELFFVLVYTFLRVLESPRWRNTESHLPRHLSKWNAQSFNRKLHKRYDDCLIEGEREREKIEKRERERPCCSRSLSLIRICWIMFGSVSWLTGSSLSC